MKTIAICVIFFLFVIKAFSINETANLPEAEGLPIKVNIGVKYISIDALNENEGTFKATIDVRLKWRDTRLSFEKEAFTKRFKDFTNSAAEQMATQIWVPSFDIVNIEGEPISKRIAFRILFDGHVEMLIRIKALFTVNYQLERFPFDKQSLMVQLRSHKEIEERLSFEFTQDEIDFSQGPEKFNISGWKKSLVELSRQTVQAWHNENYTQISVSLGVQRQPGNAIGIIFFPLISSLLIPLFSIWLNKYENGSFTVQAFELASLNIGGLFALVALNFTISSSFVKLAASDNSVMRLLSLNYLVLAISLSVTILFYRYNVLKYFFNSFIEEEFFNYFSWAFPIIVILAGLTIFFFFIV